MKTTLSTELMSEGLAKILDHKRKQTKLDGWFLFQELKMHECASLQNAGKDPEAPENQADILIECVKKMRLSIPSGSVIAGTQDDAFSPSYALINPAFEIETFAGYCDPLAVYNDIKPNPETGITEERIEKTRCYLAESGYVKELSDIYKKTGVETQEVVYFVEPVTGHTIPDMRPALKHGIRKISADTPDTGPYSGQMKKALEAAVILAGRYSELAAKTAAQTSDKNEQQRLLRIAEICKKVPEYGAETLHEAVQAFALLWQVMALEQAPNPYAFSVGNLDRILNPYLKNETKEEATALVRHLLSFFMVGDRCWAISQNIMVGGIDSKGKDLTNPMTYIVLDAFFESNTPQPALSMKIHNNTPVELHNTLGRFFFTPGRLTPSLFNDEAMFDMLRKKGVADEDLPDYAIAGCQEPLIMGKESANTTNTWLNLAKILELCLADGQSMISGKKIGLTWRDMEYDSADALLHNLKDAFFKQLSFFLPRMRDAGNHCSKALRKKAVPYCSALTGCMATGHDMRDISIPGTKYNASGCLIHGLSVVADSLCAVEKYMESGIGTADDLINALKNDFAGFDKVALFLKNQDKYGNNISSADAATVEIAKKTASLINSMKNHTDALFQADFSTPSTHLLYGYWVGATPDGRKAREMLGYGIDPRPGIAERGLPARLLSAQKLPFAKMTGGYASHIGINPEEYADITTHESKMQRLRERIIEPLFMGNSGKSGPFYVYFNVDEAGHLRKVLESPETFAPNGVYIMRIHGTFVNFLDLSPAIQNDIIKRLSI